MRVNSASYGSLSRGTTQRPKAAVDSDEVTPPRQILPGETVFITCRAVGRTFRFVPKPEVVETIRFCFVLAAAKYQIRVHEFLWMSNHFHIVVTAVDDELPAFMQYLNSLTSRALNALRGRNGANVEAHYNMVVVTDPAKILEHCAYTLANPCAANLVVRAEQWKGLTSYHLEYGDKLTATRPKRGLWSEKRRAAAAAAQTKRRGRKRRKSTGRAKHRGRVVTPDEVSITLTRPPGFEEMIDADLRDEVRRQVVVREAAAEEKRAGEGRRVLGMKRVRGQHWNDYPRETESMFGPVPKASGKSRWAVLEALGRCARFIAAYRRARDAYLAGERDVEFPCGTWQMKKRFNVTCGASPP